MNNFLVVSFESTLEEHLKLARAFNVAFEINDFYDPDILDNAGKIQDIIERYKQAGIPDGSTMHGAFLDVIVHSRDAAIRKIAGLRMRQSMDIAEQLGLKAVVFHTNYQPGIIGADYESGVIKKNVEMLKELLEKHPTINIYLENMFEDNPKILVEISKKLIAYENYGICFDYGHAFVYGTDIKEWVELLAPFVKHLHINDNDLKKDLHLAVGSGLIDWDEFACFYRKYFSRCSVLIENYDSEQQKASLEFIKKLL